MTKKGWITMGLIAAASLGLLLAACGQAPMPEEEASTPTHTHSYTRQSTESEYLKTAGDCTHKAVYYYSCTCGEKGEATFEGDYQHSYTQQIATQEYCKQQATCSSPALYYYSCACGKRGEQTFAHGAAAPHTYVEQAQADYLIRPATCTLGAQYYKSCKFCGEQGSESFYFGDANGHNFTSFSCANCSCTLADFADIINENLEKPYYKTMIFAFTDQYKTEMTKITQATWDLGELTNGEVQDMKLIFTYQKSNSSTQKRIYDVKLKTPITINQLISTEVGLNDVTISQKYMFGYNPTLNEDLDANTANLTCVANLLLKDSGFSYNGDDTIMLYKRDAGSGTYGGLAGDNYTILVMTANGYRELKLTLPSGTTVDKLAAEVESGHYERAKISSSVDFTENKITII